MLSLHTGKHVSAHLVSLYDAESTYCRVYNPSVAHPGSTTQTLLPVFAVNCPACFK